MSGKISVTRSPKLLHLYMVPKSCQRQSQVAATGEEVPKKRSHNQEGPLFRVPASRASLIGKHTEEPSQITVVPVQGGTEGDGPKLYRAPSQHEHLELATESYWEPVELL